MQAKRKTLQRERGNDQRHYFIISKHTNAKAKFLFQNKYLQILKTV